MTYLQRIDYRPSLENLPPKEEKLVREHFSAYGAELLLDGIGVRWEHIDEVEVAIAPRMDGPAGWIVKRLFLGNSQRYHVGIYFGSQELVFPNVTWNIARFVVENVAFYAPQPIRYVGPENLVRLTEI
jgi:hypothetical protein